VEGTVHQSIAVKQYQPRLFHNLIIAERGGWGLAGLSI
jgi:hypothetical protein